MFATIKYLQVLHLQITENVIFSHEIVWDNKKRPCYCTQVKSISNQDISHIFTSQMLSDIVKKGQKSPACLQMLIYDKFM